MSNRKNALIERLKTEPLPEALAKASVSSEQFIDWCLEDPFFEAKVSASIANSYELQLENLKAIALTRLHQLLNGLEITERETVVATDLNGDLLKTTNSVRRRTLNPLPAIKVTLWLLERDQRKKEFINVFSQDQTESMRENQLKNALATMRRVLD